MAFITMQSAEQLSTYQRSIDLNADMGEYHDDASAAREAALMTLVTTCNIACGGHTGDEVTMARTFSLARDAGVMCGAHPSYPDREHFGRRHLDMPNDDILTHLIKQIEACERAAHLAGVRLGHLKPHGALYNDAAENYDLAQGIAGLAKTHGLALFGPPGSALEVAALQIGIDFVGEGFIDRSYQMNGALVPRDQKNAIIENIAARCAQGLNLAFGKPLKLDTGLLTLSVKTLCIHSDSPGAVETTRAMVEALDKNNVTISAATNPTG